MSWYTWGAVGASPVGGEMIHLVETLLEGVMKLGAQSDNPKIDDLQKRVIILLEKVKTAANVGMPQSKWDLYWTQYKTYRQAYQALLLESGSVPPIFPYVPSQPAEPPALIPEPSTDFSLPDTVETSPTALLPGHVALASAVVGIAVGLFIATLTGWRL